MKVERIAECSPWSILQYFWPALSDNRSCKPILCRFESGLFTQVLLYLNFIKDYIRYISLQNQIRVYTFNFFPQFD